MRILMLVPPSAGRGPITRIAPLLAAALRESGQHVRTAPWGGRGQHESLVAKVVGRWGDIVRVRRCLAREPAEVLLVQTSHEWRPLLREIPLLVVARRRVRSIVLQFHGGRSDRLVVPGNLPFKLATRIVLRLTDGILVLSSEEASALRRFSPRTGVFVVTNPFVRRPAAERPASSDGDPRPMLLFVGRLIAQKGVYDVVRATAILRERVPCRLVVAGDGPEAAGVAGLVRELGLADDVSLVGHLDADELSNVYARADVFVFPSAYPEGFPTVLSEAMSAGLPIVTTRTRGSADQLEDGINALFVPAHDPAAVAEAVVRLLADPALRETMASANRLKIDEFAPHVVAGAYVQALEEFAARAS
jgi:glycosyltransferase involved in cell wall biosynthesis